MPNKWTFQIKPIKKLLGKYVGDGKGWIDPFAGESSPAEFTNDLNPERKSKYHLPAIEFIKQLNGNKFNGVLFDPPYSARQVKECYENIGLKMSYEDTLNGMFHLEKNNIAPKIKAGGLSLSFGWNTNGLGRNRGFEIVEILLVAHGGHHNDTIVTVERKVNTSLDAFNTSA